MFQIIEHLETYVIPVWSGDGIVVKGQAYGIWSIRVDGNDALAVFSAVHTAREMAIREKRPVLIEVGLISLHAKIIVLTPHHFSVSPILC